MEVKILETVVDQIWSLLPSYCDLPTDLDKVYQSEHRMLIVKAFNQPFAELLANVLYQQVNLRPIVCHGLTNLIERNNRALQQNLDDAELVRHYRLTVGEVQQNINLLATFAQNFLSILFNVFSQTTPSSRSPIADCIKAFLGIASPEVNIITTWLILGSPKCIHQSERSPERKLEQRGRKERAAFLSPDCYRSHQYSHSLPPYRYI
jgi:ribosomal RNA-processing protein 12